mmetsp:Transcript_69150/g.144155  ORF Transcript_69150/g.144155 Transcript_69150/m.144155 type:complete len:81 (+) Transcript_69150:204-446(+)
MQTPVSGENESSVRQELIQHFQGRMEALLDGGERRKEEGAQALRRRAEEAAFRVRCSEAAVFRQACEELVRLEADAHDKE